MYRKLTIAFVLGLAASAAPAYAEGKLNIFNWAGYTPPDVVERFEKETGIDVTIDTYDTNESMLAKLKAGGGDFDIIVAGHNFVPLLRDEKLAQKIGLAQLANYDNLKPDFIKPSYDPDGDYSAPWQGGSTSFLVDTAVYDKPIDSYETLFNPPPELQGKAGMLKGAADLIPVAEQYLGIPFCTEDPAELQKVLDLLLAQKPNVKVYSGGASLREQMVSGELAITQNYSGQALRSRRAKSTLSYIYPKEGVQTWQDVQLIPAQAQNYENARKWINFTMQPDVAAMISNHAGYANGIKGGDAGMKEELRTAPEINIPEGIPTKPTETCTPKGNELQDRIVTQLLQ